MRPNSEMTRRVMAFGLALLVFGASTLAGRAQTQTRAQPPAEPQARQDAPSQTSQPPQSTKPPEGQPSGELPVNMDRIKRALDNPSSIRLDDGRLRFYLEVYARQPRFEDFIGSFDLKNGPVPRAGMTHKEFLEMVTPKELYSSAGITPLETLQFAITNWAAQALIRKGLKELREARNEHEIQSIRERIDKELAALLGKN